MQNSVYQGNQNELPTDVQIKKDFYMNHFKRRSGDAAQLHQQAENLDHNKKHPSIILLHGVRKKKKNN